MTRTEAEEAAGEVYHREAGGPYRFTPWSDLTADRREQAVTRAMRIVRAYQNANRRETTKIAPIDEMEKAK